ncbi:MAG: diguanylate cyclase, partial [Solirubrobacterales bacterium]|nr:diguanylate cyclase [Solirubrobacterales bacterium]
MILPEAYLFDEERIGALRESGLLTRDADPSCDRWTRLAHELTGAPIALMTVVTDEGQLFKSHVGLPPELAAVGWLPLTHSVCRHVVAGRRRFVAGDTRDDLRLLGHPVVAEHGIAAYAGHPLTLGDGHVVGALSVLDVVPREWSPGALRLLEDLAAGLDAELGLRTARRRLLAARRDLERQQLHDPATGLANRDCFTRDLRAAVKGDGPPLLGVFGLDAFRAYNEALGHAAGDALLEELAGRLRDAVAPAGGLAYRIAGDEFGVLVHDDTAISA